MSITVVKKQDLSLVSRSPLTAPSEEISQGPARANRALALILATYFVISLAYGLLVPVGEAPDEPSHVDYAQILLRTGQLPTIPKGSARYSYEAEQPPLYYFLQAAWISVVQPNSTNLLP